MPPLSVLVTGASTGIGEATAYRLSANGHHVFAGVRKDEDGERLSAHARGRITPLRLDVTNETDIEQAVDAIAIEVERISEGQRFTTKLLAERAGASSGPGAGDQSRRG